MPRRAAGFAMPDGSQQVSIVKDRANAGWRPGEPGPPCESDFAHPFLDFGTLQLKSF